MSRSSPPRRPLVFGEVLFDCFADGTEKLGGAPFNVAWHLRGLGADPLLVSRVGDDERGRRIREEMARWAMDTSGLQLDPLHPTGTVQVHAGTDDVRYEIVSERAYDFVEWRPELSSADPAILYHGTLAARHPRSRQTLHRLLHMWDTIVFMDVNLRAPWWSAADVAQRLTTADIAKLNEDEFEELFPGQADLPSRAEEIVARIGLRQLCVTRGAQGAMVFVPGEPPCAIAPPAALEVVDTVGAGDAFAAVLLLGWIQGWDLRLTLDRAQEFAGSVVARRGALIDDIGFYRALRAAWSLA